MIYATLDEGAIFTPLTPEAGFLYDAAERPVAKLDSWELEDSRRLGVADRICEERNP